MDSIDKQKPDGTTVDIDQMQETKSSELCEPKGISFKVGPNECGQSELFDSLDSLQKAICEYEENTQSNFIIRQKSKDFGNEDVKPNSNFRIHWESQTTELCKLISFTGVPFVIVGRKSLQCHLGKDLSIQKKKKYREERHICQGEDHAFIKRRQNVQHTKKMGCPAEIYILHIIRYPDFKIEIDTKKRRTKASKKLKEALTSDAEKIVGIHAYITRFPKTSEHKLHATSGELANIREKIDKRVQQKIISLHRNGIRKINEMMRHINAFVSQELFPGEEPPAALRRRFYPTRKDIANLILKAKSEGQNSSLDQENILTLLQQWQDQTPDIKLFCRPNSIDEKTSDKKTFLFCYQTAWQQKLLQKYGNQITLLDATYRTTRYALPLFFLCVRTNVCYVVVGAFVTQQENTESIQEALQIFRKWNDNWKPNCFLVDFCLEEINAISALFEETKIWLCDFHREKAWTEWVNKKVHGVHKSRSCVLKMLRNIALAPTMEEYNSALHSLTHSEIWNSSDALRQWLTNKWMPEIKKWAHVFRTGVSHIVINTNNGLERQNETLKHTYMDGYKNCTLSDLITVLHQSFFPQTFKKYVQLNLQNSDLYRKYHEEIPDWLKNRPREFVSHIIKRFSSNLDKGHVTCLDNTRGIFKVNSESDPEMSYTVNLGGDSPVCSCRDWGKFLLPCKHICCILKFVDGWGWEKINPSYSNNPLFTLDIECFAQTSAKESTEEKNTSEGNMTDFLKSEEHLDFLPRRRTKRTMLIRNCSQKLKKIIDAVYLQKDDKYLIELEKKIDHLLEDVTLNIPKDQNLPLIETPKKKNIAKNIKPLPKRQYGKPKQAASQRVGSKAEMLRHDVWQTVEMEKEENSESEELNNAFKDSTWVVIRGISLKYADKEALASQEWLDDNIINVSQALISKALPTFGGLYDTVLLANRSVSPVVADNAIQIHHLGAHWVVSHRSQKQLTVYDSLKPSEMQESLKTQILHMYAPLFSGEYSVLEVNLVCCQKQHGANDCGVFAVANAVALANNINLKLIQFEQTQLRQHLITCIEEKKITMFPHIKLDKPKKTFSKKVTLTTNCHCKIHKPKETMVECSSCKNWFHITCVGLKKDDRCLTTKQKFICPTCAKKKC